jgi:hypothetical protein
VYFGCVRAHAGINVAGARALGLLALTSHTRHQHMQRRSHTDDGDPKPTFEMGFDCAYGLSRVRVYNRVDSAEARPLINSFSLDYVVNGAVKQTYDFAGAEDFYDVDIAAR